MRKLLIRALSVLALLVITAIAYVQMTLVLASGGLPQWDGELAASGIGAEVVIRRDEHGVPRIQAATEADLYFAQGFVHAQDRFWQMSLARQATLGRLSEWFGSSTLTNDRIFRMWGWGQAAKSSYESLSADDKRSIDAYADGVNAWLDSEFYRRPPEMRILHIHPEPWSPSDSFVIGHALSQTWSTYGSELVHARLQDAGMSDTELDMLDPNVEAAPPIIPSPNGEAMTQRSMPLKRHAFSNNWTLSGEHTASGLPLMANDPQIPISLPNTWQLQVHVLGDRTLAGGTLPGTPGIVVGHNGSVAWGVTNGVVDVIDFVYLEEHPEDEKLYRRSPSSDWEAYNERAETIGVRFGSDHVETLRRTSKGVVWPVGLGTSFMDGDTNTGLELRAVAVDVPGSSPMAIVRLNRANTVEEGIEALRDMTALAINVSLADVDGNIGYVMTGRIALRSEQHATTVGFYPDDDNDWVFATYDANPRVINPPGGRLVSANQKIVDDTKAPYLSDFWSAPYRAWRIHELLDEKEIHDVDSFRSMQMNTLSPVARRLVPLMLQVEPTDSDDGVLLSILEDWDYHFTLDSRAATVWTAWASILRREVLDDELGGLQSPDHGGRFVPLERVLSGEKAEWCDDVRTEAVEDCANALAVSLTATRLLLEASLGSEPSEWRWGHASKFRLSHQGLGDLPVIGPRFSRETPLQGGPESLFINSLLLVEAPSFSTSIFSSSYQGIYDLSNLGDSLFMVAGGTSGHFKSPHYDDMTSRWVKGERVRLGSELENPAAEIRIKPVTR